MSKDYIELAKAASSNEGSLSFAIIAIAEDLRRIRQMMETPEPIKHVDRGSIAPEQMVRESRIDYGTPLERYGHFAADPCMCLRNIDCVEHGDVAKEEAEAMRPAND